ncbi:MAG: type II toxin-antitoxin system VapC family toxin [Candidatus Methanoperedens sp.]|nr:type II toxin-antitoxin system VapC family toxin [Candidatus Methanoperedens sp.]
MVDFRRIGLDTNALIYYIEEHPVLMKKVEFFINKIEDGDAIGITSYVTMLELLVKPMREGRFDLVEKYRTILSGKLEMVPLDETVSIKAAELRAKYGFRTPDAIQLASVIHKKGDVFITNDRGLKRITEIKVLALEDI